MKAMMRPLKSRVRSALRWLDRRPVATAPAVDPRLASARKYFGNGALPTDFSINLGAAPCNHTCLFCPQSIKKPKKASWLDLDLLRKVLGEMPMTGVRLNISSYSETLAAPNLVPAVRLMKEIRPSLPISMATNGSLFRQDVIEALIDADLDHYQYSFDAPTKETYSKLMQVDHFDRVEENLNRLIEMRNRKNSRMVITAHVMEFKEIEKENEEFLTRLRPRLNKGDGADLRRVANWGGGVWGLNDQLKSAGFTPKYTPQEKRVPCISIFMHFKMQHDGRYAPCVAAVPDSTPEEEVHNVGYIGSAKEITWMEAWQRLSEMRRAHLEGRWNDYECCRTCNIWGLWQDVWKDNQVSAPGRSRFEVEGVEYASSVQGDR